MKTQLSRWLPLLLSLALIYAVSTDFNPYRLLLGPLSQPAKDAEESVGQALVGHAIGEEELFGTPGHVLEFALLGLTAARALIWKRNPGLIAWLWVFAAGELYALSDEIHQVFVPGRAFELSDLVLDGAGILGGLLIYGLLMRWQGRREREEV